MTVPPLPSWATPKTAGGPPAPDSPLDRQFAAFVGPRWTRYRAKFAPFFREPHFTPTWNWAAALLSPFWFLYRKLYVPFVFFFFAPYVAFALLWGDGAPPVMQVPNPKAPNGPPLQTPTPEALLLMLGILLSSAILAGGTANYLLFRRAVAAIRVVTPRAPDAEAALPLLGRIGGVSWRAVLVGFAILVGMQLLSAAAAAR